MLGLDQRQLVLIVGDWVAMGSYYFTIQLVFDLLSVPMVILTFLLCGIIVAFTNRYLHRESGYHRFFVFFALFLAGMVVAALAGTIEMLLVGWEMVGLSSVMLVAFFQERPQPIRNALRLWVVYRVADAALLLAVVVMHHQGETGTGHLLWGEFSWPQKTSGVAAGLELVGRFVASDSCCREVGLASLFRLAAPGHGGANAFQRYLLWSFVSSSRCVSVVAAGPFMGKYPIVGLPVGSIGLGNSLVRVSCR